jgi:hypothetical protein
MKKYITGIVLFSIPFFSSAEIKFVSEILVGQSKHNLDAFIQPTFEKKSTSSKDNSFGFRLGLKVLDNITFELAKHHNGSFDNLITVTDSYGGCCSYKYKMITKVETSSIRYGVKGEIELYAGLSVNARIGIARWEDSQSYSRILEVDGYDGERSGNDLYYALGTSFKLSEDLYIGFEYSLVTINDRIYINNEIVNSYKHDIEDLSLILGWEF